MGCVAGSKDSPNEAPSLDSVRCVKTDLVCSTVPKRCIWSTQEQGVSFNGSSDENFEQQDLSLWTVDASMTYAVIQSLDFNEDGKDSPPVVAPILNLSENDNVLLAPVSLQTVESFATSLIQGFALMSALCEQEIATSKTVNAYLSHLLRPSLSQSLFSLIHRESK